MESDWLTWPATDGSDFMGERLTVQFARGSRNREPGGFGNHERAPLRPRRTPHRMQITGLPSDTSWQVCAIFPFLVPGLQGSLSSHHHHPPEELPVRPRSEPNFT